MKSFLLSVLATATLTGFLLQPAKKPTALFNGKNFHGWTGDTVNTWRVEDGAIVGGFADKMVPHNDFLTTARPYGNFILRLQFKLTGTKGFVNGGVQFHSKRHTKPAYEMIGYQADIGDKYWGCLYDESRRDKVLARPDSAQALKWVKLNDWNQYEVRSQNGRIRLTLNGHPTVDYTEPDKSIPQSGLIGLQVHGGGITQIRYRNITIEELEGTN
ncbi:3-keto-disaccharide hydrolase [Tellurirhabdus rosea]|uniref:3-keto-disaccharide hydrolase n=1 Tax=Tellurirhabdus rosea TaxID=2674997 RepID=UPI00225341DC|nr:DUF1080 domain-containing protein [Tellurirhabdus rosea]